MKSDMKCYDVTGMSCAACSAHVEKAVSKVEGVSEVSVSLLTNSMNVEGTASPEAVIQAVEKAGYRAKAFDAEVMINGDEKVKNKMKEIEMMGNNATPKDKDMYDDLEIVHEMYQRGFRFLPIDLYKSHATKFQIEGEYLRPPLNSIAGLGNVAAESIAKAREEEKFMSIDDLKIRAKIGDSVTELLRQFGCLEGMSQSNQLSLFG